MNKIKANQLLAAVEREAPDWDPHIIMAHAAHETGNFEHVIGWNNFWGLKYPRTLWRRELIDLEPIKTPTTERFTDMAAFARFWKRNKEDVIDIDWQSDRKRFNIKCYAKWADWSREAKAVIYYDKHVANLFTPAYPHRQDNPEKYFRGLFAGPYRYATDDPDDYVRSCMGLYTKRKWL